MQRAYSVNYWGSHPDEDNDDCLSGDEYGTLAEAEAAYLAEPFTGCRRDTAWIVLDGPDVSRERRNPAYRPSRDDGDADWQREIANEAGMLHGAEAYNDEMGWGRG